MSGWTPGEVVFGRALEQEANDEGLELAIPGACDGEHSGVMTGHADLRPAHADKKGQTPTVRMPVAPDLDDQYTGFASTYH
jgi:hypothetical protein